MEGLRGLIGHTLISGAIGQFTVIAEKLETGIEHCKAEIINHQSDILAKNQKIKLLDAHVDQANRVLGNIKAFVA